MEQIMYQKSYQEYKAELDGELQRTAEGFVRIGYLLKVARDTNVLAESGYKSVAEFAQAEYNLDKTQVSRFININDKFSENGYSDHLLPSYQGYGYAKLTIMLQLPDAVNETLDPDMSKAEIQTIHEEYKEEMKKSDLEIMMEEPLVKNPQRQQDSKNNLDKAIYLIGKSYPEIYEQAYYEVHCDCGEGIADAFAPNEEQLYTVRVPAVGKLIVSIKGYGKPVILTNMRSGEKEEYSWTEMEETVSNLIPENPRDEYDAKKCWEDLYGESWPVEEEPKKAEVAPVQQSKQETKPKKESKVKVVKEKPVKKEVPKVEETMPKTVEEPKQDDFGTEKERFGTEKEDFGAENKVIDAEYREISEIVPKKSEIVPENKDIEKSDNENELPDNKNELSDNENVENTICDEHLDALKKIFNQIRDGYGPVSRFLLTKSPGTILLTQESYEDAKDVYKNAVDMAAGFEKLMMYMEEHAHGK